MSLPPGGRRSGGPRRVEGMPNFGLGLAPAGRVFYVNSNTASLARNADRDWFNIAQQYDTRNPIVFATLQEAIDACVASRGDVIYIARGTETVTETVAFNKTGITVMVQNFGGHRVAMGEYTALLANASFTDGPVATFTAPCTVIGLGFVGRDTGATFWGGASALIGGLATASPYGVHLYQCRFPKWGLDARIGLSIEGSSNVMIEECEFEGVTTDLESGIYLQGAAQNIKIHNNTFADCDYALTLGAFAGGGPYLDFYGNTVIGADSKGVNTQANTAVGVIRGNYFNTDVGTATFDRTVDQLDTQGIQCMGNNYKDEDPGPT